MLKHQAPIGLKELQQLRDTVQRLEQRVQSLESIVTGAEYPAAQRVAKALEEPPAAEFSRARDRVAEGA